MSYFRARARVFRQSRLRLLQSCCVIIMRRNKEKQRHFSEDVEAAEKGPREKMIRLRPRGLFLQFRCRKILWKRENHQKLRGKEGGGECRVCSHAADGFKEGERDRRALLPVPGKGVLAAGSAWGEKAINHQPGSFFESLPRMRISPHKLGNSTILTSATPSFRLGVGVPCTSSSASSFSRRLSLRGIPHKILAATSGRPPILSSPERQ